MEKKTLTESAVADPTKMAEFEQLDVMKQVEKLQALLPWEAWQDLKGQMDTDDEEEEEDEKQETDQKNILSMLRRSYMNYLSVLQDKGAEGKSDMDKPVRVIVRPPSITKMSSLKRLDGHGSRLHSAQKKGVRITESAGSLDEIPQEFMPVNPGNMKPYAFLKVAGDLELKQVAQQPPTLSESEGKEETPAKGEGESPMEPESEQYATLMEKWASMLPPMPGPYEYPGPSILHSTSRGNPLGPFGFELEMNLKDRSRRVDHVMSIKDLEETLANAMPFMEEGVIACTHLVCRNRCINDIDIMKNFIHLRYVYLPYNRIKSLLALNKFQYLILLDVGHNRIESAGLIPKLELEAINLTDNLLKDLEEFPENNLGYACFNHNKLTSLEGLNMECFTILKCLELRGNKLKSLGKLDLPNLQHLWAADNQLTSLGDLENLINLESFHARTNNIQSLADFPDTLSKLIYLNLRDNNIDRITHVRQLNRSPLECLVLMQNMVYHTDRYRVEVIASITTLQRLDKSLVSETDLIGAEGLRQGRMARFLPPLRDEVVSATPPPTPATEMSEAETMTQRSATADTTSKAQEAAEKPETSPQEIAPQRPSMVDSSVSAGDASAKPKANQKVPAKLDQMSDVQRYDGATNLHNSKTPKSDVAPPWEKKPETTKNAESQALPKPKK